MRISRIYHPEHLALEKQVVLTEEKGHYLIHVLRHKINDEVILFHQAGVEFSGKIASIEGKKKPIVQIMLYAENIKKTESALAVTLVQALAKNDKIDLIIQKAVELGVYEIFPVFTEFSDVKFNAERMISKQQHWQNIAISAAEQSERTQVPIIHPPIKIVDCLPKLASEYTFCLHPHLPAVPLSQQLNKVKHPKTITVLVGPEGGFSPKEIVLFEQKNYTFVTLGPRILRTETAAIVMQSILQHHFGDIH